jgi:hypothetical protein
VFTLLRNHLYSLNRNEVYSLRRNGVFSLLRNIQPDAIKIGADLGLAKIKLLDQVKSETDNKWLKKVLSFGLKKIKLDDVDLSQNNIAFTDIIKTKTMTLPILIYCILHNVMKNI